MSTWAARFTLGRAESAANAGASREARASWRVPRQICTTSSQTKDGTWFSLLRGPESKATAYKFGQAHDTEFSSPPHEADDPPSIPFRSVSPFLLIVLLSSSSPSWSLSSSHQLLLPPIFSSSSSSSFSVVRVLPHLFSHRSSSITPSSFRIPPPSSSILPRYSIFLSLPPRARREEWQEGGGAREEGGGRTLEEEEGDGVGARAGKKW